MQTNEIINQSILGKKLSTINQIVSTLTIPKLAASAGTRDILPAAAGNKCQASIVSGKCIRKANWKLSIIQYESTFHLYQPKLSEISKNYK